MIAVAALGYILLFLLLILLAVLFIPIKYRVMGQKSQEIFINAEVSWFFNGLRFIFIKQTGIKANVSFKLFGFEVKSKKTNKTKKKSTKNKKKKDNKKRDMILDKEFISQIFKTVKNLLRVLKPEVFEIKGIFGFDDPYYTGIACAFVNNIPHYGESFNIKLTPVFDEEILEGKLNIQGKIVFAVIAWLAIKFILSKPVRNKIFKKERKIKNYANQC